MQPPPALSGREVVRVFVAKGTPRSLIRAANVTVEELLAALDSQSAGHRAGPTEPLPPTVQVRAYPARFARPDAPAPFGPRTPRTHIPIGILDERSLGKSTYEADALYCEVTGSLPRANAGFGHTILSPREVAQPPDAEASAREAECHPC